MKDSEIYQDDRQLYNNYQWIWDLVSSPEEYRKLAGYIIEKIKEHQKINTRSVLHLGCGSGCIDVHLKKHFDITGVDLSDNMLESAQNKNPECNYFKGDMRDFNINKKYDAVIIPDSIDYMLSVDEINSVYKNAKQHLNNNGLFIVIVGYDPEKFPQNRTTADECIEKDRVVTFIENNYVPDFSKNAFEATFVYLIREKGKLKTVIDMQNLGLFKQEIWLNAMTKAGFKAELIHDPYLEEIEQEGTFMIIGQ